MDLLILVILIRRIIKYAKFKNQPGWKWGLYLGLNWFAFELLGVSFVTHYLNIKYDLEFMMTNPFYALLIAIFGIGCGFLGYFLTRRLLDKIPASHV